MLVLTNRQSFLLLKVLLQMSFQKTRGKNTAVYDYVSSSIKPIMFFWNRESYIERINTCEGHMCSVNYTYFSHSEEWNQFWLICDNRLSLQNLMNYRVASVPVGWLALAVIYSLGSVQVKYRLEKDHVLDSRWGCWPTRWPIFLTWKPSRRMEM